jgi:predicted glycosyltransferase involved in capsule biosynthesis
MMPNNKITIVIPIRLSSHLFEGEKRLEFIIKNVPNQYFNILIIDYGSNDKNNNILKSLDNKSHIKIYTVTLSADSPFSIGKARDIGSQHASTPIIFFHDVDFICTTEMYFNIYAEIMARDMIKNTADFFCVPIAFLNAHGTSHFIDNFKTPFINNTHHQKLLTESNEICDFIAYGSSAIVVNRYHYLRLGGHNKKFFGHGAEDYDILHKLTSFYPKGKRPSKYYKDTKSNLISEYIGFRAFFSLYGIDVFYKGISMVHLWHPTRSLPNYLQSKKNFSILKKVMKDYDKKKYFPVPLEDKNKDKKTLVLSHEKSIFIRSIRDAIPAMGSIIFIDERKFKDVKELESYCCKEKIKTIGFKNPYGNPHRLKLYQKIKNSNISFWVMDRGALPDSWFFDSLGFNYDSANYNKSKWDKKLNNDENNRVEKYINDISKGDITLEENGSRIGADQLKKRLNVKNKKILFIPFQRPSDSVCRYFSGKMQSAQGFYHFVECLIEKIDQSKWLILGKKHPLERKNPDITGLLFVENDTHINDLISIADKILLLNSGVGLLALLFNKPVIYTGRAFYGHEGMNFYAESIEEAEKLISSTLLIDKNLVNKFVYHLINNVYSFGKTEYKKTKGKEKSVQMLARSIEFEEIRGLSKDTIFLRKRGSHVSLNEPLFNSFGGSDRIIYMKSLSFFKINNKKYNTKQKIGLFLFFSLLYPFTSKNKIEKLRRNPATFFRDSKSWLVVKIGRTIGIG